MSFVRSGVTWVLIDAEWGWDNAGRTIRQAANALFGPSARPTAIVLTHLHPDHSGAVLELARTRGCPVYVPREELPLAVARELSTVAQFVNPRDPRIILPLLRSMPRHRVEAMLAKTSLEGFARALHPGATVPGLPEWTCD